MPTNDPEYQKHYRDAHYAANKQKYIDQAQARREKLIEEVRAIKSRPCMDCGGTFNPWQMDFDHRPGEPKVGNVATLINKYNRKAVFDEIAKCDIVCSNCHRERTYQRNQAPVV